MELSLNIVPIYVKTKHIGEQKKWKKNRKIEKHVLSNHLTRKCNGLWSHNTCLTEHGWSSDQEVLYLWGVLFKNLNDATLSSLGNPWNMQMKTAITENLVFVNISVTIHGIKLILVFIPKFWGVNNTIKPF